MEPELHIDSYTDWNESVWTELRPMYAEAFPHGAKPEGVLRAMLNRKLASLSVLRRDGEAAGFAITGTVSRRKGAGDLRIIDYLAVRADLRGRGCGALLVDDIAERDRREGGVSALLIEAEVGETEEDRSRARFWERLGFAPTDYVHTYIWVPEPYRAYLKPLNPGAPVTPDGRELFRYIETFHKAAFMRYDKRD